MFKVILGEWIIVDCNGVNRIEVVDNVQQWRNGCMGVCLNVLYVCFDAFVLRVWCLNNRVWMWQCQFHDASVCQPQWKRVGVVIVLDGRNQVLFVDFWWNEEDERMVIVNVMVCDIGSLVGSKIKQLVLLNELSFPSWVCWQRHDCATFVSYGMQDTKKQGNKHRILVCSNIVATHGTGGVMTQPLVQCFGAEHVLAVLDDGDGIVGLKRFHGDGAAGGGWMVEVSVDGTLNGSLYLFFGWERTRWFFVGKEAAQNVVHFFFCSVEAEDGNWFNGRRRGGVRWMEQLLYLSQDVGIGLPQLLDLVVVMVDVAQVVVVGLVQDLHVPQLFIAQSIGARRWKRGSGHAFARDE